MLTYNLSPLLKARGIKNGYTFLKKIGLTHITAQKINAGQHRSMRLDHIEKICLGLHCTPNDMLLWVPGDQPVDHDHPLHELVEQEDLDLLSEIKDLPLDKLDELKQKLNEWKGEK